MALNITEFHPVESEEVGFRLPLSAQSIGTYGFPVYRFPIWYHTDTVLRRKSGISVNKLTNLSSPYSLLSL